MFAQPTNDNCSGAINIPSINDYCSSPGEFSNEMATEDPGLDMAGLASACFLNHPNGVWFTFTPTLPDIAFSVFATNPTAGMNMSIFEGNCGNLTLFGCSTGSSANDELILTGFTLGQTYYLLVETQGVTTQFQLCIDDFVAPKAPESDCPDAVVLCDKSSFSIEQLIGEGNIQNEMFGSCVQPGQEIEKASAWYVWTCDQSGTLEFTLTPNNVADPLEDLDFVVYEFVNGFDDCDQRFSVRCMLSGQGGPNEERCLGPTGLRAGETDIEEFSGCQDPNDNNFVAPLDMVSGKSYGLLINNFSQTGFGFSIDFGGTGTFLGPEPDFELEAIVAFECDKTLIVTNQSQSLTDPIVNYSWNFGVGAEPQVDTGEGPHEILYESFGPKSITLTVESSRGCILTKILDVDIAACCADTSTLDIEAFAQDISCFGANDGIAFVDGISGAPQYNFSIDGGPFIPNTEFNGLGPGIYELTVQDIKGCEETTIVTIEEPIPILPDAGQDITIDLGFTGELNAIYSPISPGDSIVWEPSEGLSCTNCLNPDVISPGTTTYSFTVIDANGCSEQDFVTVTTNIIRPLYFPNVITPTSFDGNDVFYIGSGPQVDTIEELKVYDRWGNPIYQCENIPTNDRNFGWDGRFGICNQTTRLVDPGVFVWTARIRFIDNEVITYAGDLTVLN